MDGDGWGPPAAGTGGGGGYKRHGRGDPDRHAARKHPALAPGGNQQDPWRQNRPGRGQASGPAVKVEQADDGWGSASAVADDGWGSAPAASANGWGTVPAQPQWSAARDAPTKHQDQLHRRSPVDVFERACGGHAGGRSVSAAALPILAHRAAIVDLIARHQVTIVTGATGSGKTTQLPQFLLAAVRNANILVTQPRRIAATSIASRVAHEMRAGPVGGVVGYQIGMNPKFGASTRLLFCTTGILLRRLVKGRLRALEEFSHIILDELHETTIDMAFVITILKRMLPSAKRVRVVLMSATLDAGRLTRYFSSETDQPFHHHAGLTRSPLLPAAPTAGDPWGDAVAHRPGGHAKDNWAAGSRAATDVPVVAVDGRLFDVEVAFIEDVYALLDPATKGALRDRPDPAFAGYSSADHAALVGECSIELNPSRPRVNHAMIRLVCQLILAIDFHDALRTKRRAASVLVFLPGIGEIRGVQEELENVCYSRPELNDRFVIVALHSEIARDEQQRAFQKFDDKRKVILATNIAESSITVEDVRYVIDLGVSREKVYDPLSRMESLQTVVASKASCKQRQGRAGRLGPGLCFRMYPQSWWADGSTPEHGVSEMQRSPLERLVLQSLVLGVPAPEEFLLDAMEPPAEVTVIEAVARLIDVGAVEADRTPARGRAGGRYDAGGPCGRHDAAPRCGRLTDLGRICADLPLDIQLTRLILLGRVFGLTGDAIDLAACMSSTRLFRRGNRDQELEAFASRLAWSDGSQSDAIAALNIYRAHRANRLRNDRFVDRAALREIDDLVQDTRSRLASVHISPDNLACALDSEFARKAGGVLYLLLYGAAYPNVFGGNARKFLSVAGDDRIDDLLETKQAEVVIEVANAPNSAEDHGQTPLRQTEHDIGEVFEAAGRVREVSLVWSDQDRSNWLVKFDAGAQLAETVLHCGLKLGDLAADARPTDCRYWQLAGGTVGCPGRVDFVTVKDRTAPPVMVARESVNSVVLIRRMMGLARMGCLVCAFVAKTANTASSYKRRDANSGLQARCTTMMPKAWPLALPLLSLMFGRTLELRTNRRATKLLGIKVDHAQEIELDQLVGRDDMLALDQIRAALMDGLSSCLPPAAGAAPANAAAAAAAAPVLHRPPPQELALLALRLLEERRPDFMPRKRYRDHPSVSVPADCGRGGQNATSMPPLGVVLRAGLPSEVEDCSDDEAGDQRRCEVSRLWDSAIANRQRNCFVCRWEGNSANRLLGHLRTAQHKKREEQYIRDS